MKFNSLVTGELLAVLDSPEPSPETSRPEIPNIINLMLTPSGITRADVTAQTRVESHYCSDARTVANAALSSATMTTIKKGIWRVTGMYQWVAGAIVAPAINVIRIAQGGAVIGNLGTWFPHTAVAVQGQVYIDQQLCVDRDTDIIHLVNATGVGERATATVTLHLQRIV